MAKNELYNGGLTREQFLFFEIRIVARLVLEGLSRAEILQKLMTENLFQFPTEKMVTSIAGTCFRRIDTLGTKSLVRDLACAPPDVAKQINLYAMMRYNRLVYEFMTMVIGEKYRTRDDRLTSMDMNLFFTWLQEQSDDVASWSDGTIAKIRQVLKRALIECGYLDSVRSEKLNPVSLYDELAAGIRENRDFEVFPAFNHFE